MSSSDNSSNLFRQDVYEQSFSEIRDLKRSLPEDVVVSLAREVLVRLSEHFDNDAGHVTEITDEQIEDLAQALISPDTQQAAKLVSAERASGTSIKTLYLTYLGGAARRLGEWWEQDTVSFAQVIAGSGRIYAIMRGLRPIFLKDAAPAPTKSALFAAVPGETHQLGIKMAADLLENEGWSIDLQLLDSHDALIEVISRTSPRIIGLSAAGEHALAPLAKLVVAIRLCAPGAQIMVSGHIVEKCRDTVRLMGVDALHAGFDQAKEALDELWDESSP